MVAARPAHGWSWSLPGCDIRDCARGGFSPGDVFSGCPRGGPPYGSLRGTSVEVARPASGLAGRGGVTAKAPGYFRMGRTMTRCECA